MKCSFVSVGTALMMIGMLCACAKADDLGLTRQHDPWGRYDPGAWVLVRVKTEAFNEGGIAAKETRRGLHLLHLMLLWDVVRYCRQTVDLWLHSLNRQVAADL